MIKSLIFLLIQEIDPTMVESILTLRNVTVMGVLVSFVAYLIWTIHKLKKEQDVEKELLRNEIKYAREKLESEYQNGNKEMKGIIEKYHILATQTLENLKPR